MITINFYKKSDFNISEKGIWLVAKWRTPELRLPTRYKNIFISKYHVAEYRDMVCIPQSTMDKALEDLDSYYKVHIPTPVISKEADYNKWNEYLNKHRLIKEGCERTF